MSGHDADKPDTRFGFRQAAKAVCKPSAKNANTGSHATSILSARGNTAGNTQNGNTKSFTQVESLVLPPHSGALKRDSIAVGVTIGVTISDEYRITGQRWTAGIITQGGLCVAASR